MLVYDLKVTSGARVISYEITKDNIYLQETQLTAATASIIDAPDSKLFLLPLTKAVISHPLRQYILYCLTKPLFGADLDVRITITHDGAFRKDIQADVDILNKVHEARIISMLPSNQATPLQMFKEFKHIFSSCPDVRVRLITAKAMRKLGLNLMLAIGDSSSNKPCFVIVERRFRKPSKTVCICGKGVTFDAGGLSIKPIGHMVDMKFDKIGAVYGAYALRALVEDQTMKSTSLIGLFPFADNVISDRAVHPGDVVTSFSGKTVEITDPDAEGRLLLADALSYAEAKYKPDLIVDMATLTGNAAGVNCFQTAYYYASTPALSKLVYTAGETTGERMNPMPQWTEYSKVLKSKVADIQSVSYTHNCDAYMAMLFMREFVSLKTDWIHLDLTSAYKDHEPTGKGVRAAIEIIKNYVKR
jgi:leucyl aminopeptidase